MEKAQGEIAKREQRMADPNLFTKDPATFNTLAQEMTKLRESSKPWKRNGWSWRCCARKLKGDLVAIS